MEKPDFVSKIGPVYPLADPNESHKETFKEASDLYKKQIEPLLFKLQNQYPQEEELASLIKTVQTLRVTYGDAYFKVANPSPDNAKSRCI